MDAVSSVILIAWINAAAGGAIAAWAFWRLNATRGHGDWWLKWSVLSVFAAACWWSIDNLQALRHSWDEPALCCAVALYLWCGVWKHYRRDQRRERRA